MILRHSAVARTLGSIVTSVIDTKCRYEQRIPSLDKDLNGKTCRAIMDIVYLDHQGHTRMLDVSIVSACAGAPQTVLAAARKDGHAAHRACCCGFLVRLRLWAPDYQFV